MVKSYPQYQITHLIVGDPNPPYNAQTSREMYNTSLPETAKLLKAGARVCKVGFLMFLLLGNTNYQGHPKGVKRIGYLAITVVTK